MPMIRLLLAVHVHGAKLQHGATAAHVETEATPGLGDQRLMKSQGKFLSGNQHHQLIEYNSGLIVG